MSKEAQWNPQNPHPLSRMKTELVWEGKYDEWGNRREVDIAGCAMPMQKIETIDQPRSEAAAVGQRELDLFEKKTTRLDDFRNRLIWGDNKLVMASLLKEFKGEIDLIYIDPPFDVGADFTMNVAVGEGEDTVGKDQSTLEMVAYRDTWGKGTDSYLSMMYERLALMKELLSEIGSIYVHGDYRVNFYLRSILNEIFNKDNLIGEFIWIYSGREMSKTHWNPKHDTVYHYGKSTQWIFNYEEVSDEPAEEVLAQYKHVDENGKRYVIRSKDGSKGLSKEGSNTYRQYYKPVPPRDYKYFSYISSSDEHTGYATQKPEDLITHFVKASSNEDSIVADFFCGSGTTGAVAERLGRRWIMADLGRFGIHTSRKRLIELQRKLHTECKPYRAFDVYNLGRYERQWWQKEYLKDADEEHRRVVLEFFKAEVLESAPSPMIHGRKAGSFCHVDGIDSIFTRDEATAVAKAVAGAGGKECYCLAWEFEMDLRLTTAALEKELGVKLKLIQIPREIMEKNRTSPPPFLEMAVLEVEPVYRGKGKNRSVDIKLTKFMPSLAEVPSKELEALKERAIKSGFDFIDFWAVDFDWQPGKPFNHHWQDYRTRKDRTLKTVSEAGYKYPKKGKYTACVKVVDTFGCDTSVTVEVKV